MKIDPARLPHWARVEFAVACARSVQPLFDQAWPNAAADRREALDNAIELADRSVTEKRDADGLEAAVLNAIMTAGRAVRAHFYQAPEYEDEDVEPLPTGEKEAFIAGHAAKVVEKAAEAANSAPARSVIPVCEAYQFALIAIRASGQFGIAKELKRRFVRIKDTHGGEKPWWRFW